MRQASFVIASLVLALGAGCSPSLSEVRLVVAPPRGPTCEIEFLTLTMEQLSTGGTHMIIGDLILAETGVQDPYQSRYRDVLRPRACAMGGDAVTILADAKSTGGAAGPTSATVYAVVQKRTAPSAEPAPPAKP